MTRSSRSFIRRMFMCSTVDMLHAMRVACVTSRATVKIRKKPDLNGEGEGRALRVSGRARVYGDVQDDDGDLLAVDVEVGPALCRRARDKPDEC